MLFVVFISVGPLLWIFVSSFKTNREILTSALSWPSTFSFVAYKNAIEVSNLNLYFLNSVLVAITSTVIILLVYSMGAYVLARYEFPLKNMTYVLLSLSILLPTNSMIQPIFKLVNLMNLYDTKTALIFVYVGFGLPIALFLLKSYFGTIPKEIEEAAYIEGSGFLSTFFRIMLPLATPALASTAVLVFLFSWNEFLFSMLLISSQENRTLPLSLRYFTQAFTYDYGALFAALTMTILPSIVIYIILQEQITKSLAGGAVKG
jgi:raffinose/stachyose/melibiose transport system permease protein